MFFSLRRSITLIALVIFMLAAGCGPLPVADWLTQAGKEEARCAQTADNFRPSHGPVQIRQDLVPYNGMDNGAWAIVKLPDGSLVVGGDFSVAGGVTALHVARWDPAAQEWSAMGPGLLQPVHELVSTPDNGLFALTLSQPDNSPTSVFIYRWSGEEWETIPQPFYNPLAYGKSVTAMAWDGDRGFFLGGNFTAAAGMAVNGIVRWDGSTWRSLDAALPLKGLFSVRALAFGPDGILYAGGTLKISANERTQRVFAWDGKSWSGRGDALPGPVEAVARSTSGRLAAIIVEDNKKPSPETGLFHWYSVELDEKNQQWVSVSAGFPAIVEGLQFGVGQIPGALPPEALTPWEGSLLQERENPLDLLRDSNQPFRLYALDGRLYALGGFRQIGNFPANNIAVWDGHAWHNMNGPQGNPVYGVVGEINALAIDRHGVVTAGGEFTTVSGGREVKNIARWDGKGWQPMGSGVDGKVTSLAIDDQDRVYAGGYFTNAGGIPAYGLARWEPAAGKWESQADRSGRVVTPLPGFSYVQALWIDPAGRLYAAGLKSGGFGVVSWDGQAWQQYPGIFDHEIFSLATDPRGGLYVGGAFSAVSGKAAHGIVSWDPQAEAWVDLGSALTSSLNNDSIRAILPGPDGSLYVGGNFRSAGNVPMCHIARLVPRPGSTQFDWSELGGGLPWLQSMTLASDGTLYAVSTQPRENGESDYQVVALSAGDRRWDKVDGIISTRNTYAIVDSLAVDPNGSLYLGGNFSQVGGFPASSFAIFRLEGQ